MGQFRGNSFALRVRLIISLLLGSGTVIGTPSTEPAALGVWKTDFQTKVVGKAPIADSDLGGEVTGKIAGQTIDYSIPAVKLIGNQLILENPWAISRDKRKVLFLK
jgi:hypothetical protein